MIPHLDTFNAIAKHGTFAAAGARLGLTQSAVSMQMRRLERELGFAVFDRSGRSAIINEAGRSVLTQSLQLNALIAQMKLSAQASNEIDVVIKGSLRLGAISTALLHDVPRALLPMRERWPLVDVRLVPGMSAELLAQVEERRLDCAMIVKPNHALDSPLAWQLLRQEPFVLLASIRERVRDVQQLLAERRFIRYERLSHGGGLVDRYLKRLKVKVRDHIEVDSLESMAIMVAQGLGICVLPRSPALKQLVAMQNVREISLGAHTFYRSVGMVWRKDSAQLSLVKGFVRLSQ